MSWLKNIHLLLPNAKFAFSQAAAVAVRAK